MDNLLSWGNLYSLPLADAPVFCKPLMSVILTTILLFQAEDPSFDGVFRKRKSWFYYIITCLSYGVGYTTNNSTPKKGCRQAGGRSLISSRDSYSIKVRNSHEFCRPYLAEYGTGNEKYQDYLAYIPLVAI